MSSCLLVVTLTFNFARDVHWRLQEEHVAIFVVRVLYTTSTSLDKHSGQIGCLPVALPLQSTASALRL